jgi:hypothetical protein
MVESLCEIIYRSDDFRCGLFLGFCSVMLLYPDGGVGLSRGRCRFVWRAVQIFTLLYGKIKRLLE